MPFCVPVSEVFRCCEASLLPLVDAVVYKDPTAVDSGYEDRVKMLESSLNLVAADFPEQAEASGFAAALQSDRFTSFSCDLGPFCRAYDVGRSANGYPRYLPAGAQMPAAEVAGRCRDNLAFLRGIFAGQVEVENLNYFPTGAYEGACEPERIAGLVRDWDLGLALDLGHAIISADHMGVAIGDYLQRLPLERVRGIHLSGPRTIGGELEDAHDAPGEREYALLDFLLARTTDPYLTVEHYADGDALVAAYRRLRGMLARAKVGRGG